MYRIYFFQSKFFYLCTSVWALSQKKEIGHKRYFDEYERGLLELRSDICYNATSQS